MEIKIKICWVIALHAEARPIIEAYRMKIFSNELIFPVYINHETGHALVISGIGTARSAAAATYLKTLLSIENYAAWVNIGIAGFFKEPVGKIYQALKVLNCHDNQAFFPGLRLSDYVQGSPLLTVSKPELNFASRVLYDMEAAGFCEVAPLFSCNELTFVFKVVSDTPMTKFNNSKKFVKGLLENNMEIISKLLMQIEEVVAEEEKRLRMPEEVKEVMAIFHFTESNRHNFEMVYRKWRSTFPDRKFDEVQPPENSAKALINNLEKELLDEVKDWTLT
ncbi:MAG: hypothetical protein CMM83_06300 [Rhodospirillales bacterium]|nr:hypothetical protein [Rhodospirillales bacterium]